MLKQRWGRIINITSVFGQMARPGRRTIRLQGGADRPDHGHRPRSGIAQHYLQRRRPRFIETAMTAVLSEEFKQTAVKQIPLGRSGPQKTLREPSRFWPRTTRRTSPATCSA